MGEASAELEAEAAERERDVDRALTASDAARILTLTADLERFPVAWPSRLRLDLARVAALELQRRRAEAAEAMREALDVHLKIDVEAELAREARLAPVEHAWDRLHDAQKKRTRRPVWLLLALAGVAVPFGAMFVFIGDSYRLVCERTVEATADCTITRFWMGTERERRTVRSVRHAFAYRPSADGGERMALRTADGEEVDVHPNALSEDGERAEAFVAFLQEGSSRDVYEDRWDMSGLIVAGFAILLGALMTALLALGKLVRVQWSRR